MTDLFWPPKTSEPVASDYPPGWTPQPAQVPPPPDTPATQGSRHGAPWRRTAAVAGLSALVFGGIGVGVGAAVVGDDNGSPNAGLTSQASSPSALSAAPKSYAGIAARVLPSVVNINIVNGGSVAATGSGVVLRSDGFILTNNHVVADAAGGGSLTVTFNDGSTAAAAIVGTDPLDDLAVIRVRRSGLKPAVLGSTAALRVGDPVIALGSPLGLQGTVTAGIVSALNRPVQTGDEQTSPFGGSSGASTVLDAIQTDAPINPGNSGGPLVNSLGQVVGINSAIASTGSNGSIGVGFAIPIDQAKVIAGQLITSGRVNHPMLGVALADATDANGSPLARVQSLTSGGPAAKAGIQVGDIIVQVGSQQTAGAEAVIAAVRSHRPGDAVPVVVQRGSERRTVTVTLGNADSS
jgi:putative serine protease PepD